MTTPLTRSHEDATLERFRRHPDFAAEYLAAIFTDGDPDELKHALTRLKQAFNQEIE